MKAYSIDLRERIVQAVHAGQRVEEVAARFDVHPRTVWRYLRLEHERGTLDPRPRRGPAFKISPEQQELFSEQLREQPHLTYAERAALFEGEHGLRLSVPTVYRLVKRLRYARKK